MNTPAKHRLLALVAVLMLALSLAACGGSDPADEFLADYEKLVVKMEDMAKKDNITMEEAQQFLNEAMEFSNKTQKTMGANTKLSQKQVEKSQELTNRLMKAVQTVQTKAQ